MILLLLKNKSEIIQEYFIKKNKFVIGSDDKADIKIDHKMISPGHCGISILKGNVIEIKDLKSTFGIIVNGKRTQGISIGYDDIMDIGPFQFIFSPLDKPDKDSEERRCLVCILGKLAGKKYFLNKDAAKIGRDPSLNDITILESEDALTSRRHATITRTKKGYFLSDKRSKNRTRVNRHTVKENEELKLNINDEIVIGKHVFRFIVPSDIKISAPRKIYSPIYLFQKNYLAKFLKYILFLICIMFSAGSFINLMEMNSSKPALSVTAANSIKEFSSKDEFVKNPVFIMSEKKNGLKGVFIRSIIENISNIAGKEYFFKSKERAIFICSKEKGMFKMALDGTLSDFKTGGIKFDTMPIIYDMNKDGISDVIVHSLDSRLYVYDGKDKDVLYKSGIIGRQAASYPLAYFNYTKKYSNLVTSSNDRIINFIYNPINNPGAEFVKVQEKIISGPVLCSTEGEGENLVITSQDGTLYFFDQKSSEIRRQLDIKSAGNFKSLSIKTSPCVGDINDDGSDEIVYISGDDKVIVLNSKTGELLWNPVVLEKNPANPQNAQHSSCVLSDYDGDGRYDIVANSSKGRIFVIKGDTGDILTVYNTGVYNSISTEFTLADINSDKTDEVIFGTKSGHLNILGFYKDMTANLILQKKISENPIVHTILAGDFNSDAYFDIYAVSSTGEIILIETNLRSFKDYVYWPSYAGGADNFGRARNITHSFYLLNMAAFALGAVYIIVFVFFAFMVKVKRKAVWIV